MMCDENLPNACGVGGECVSNICVCLTGWRQTREFTFITSENFSQLPCDYNEVLGYVLYGLALSVSIITALCYLCSVKKKSQVIRLIPLWLGVIFLIITSGIRLSDSDFKLEIGVDIGITFCFAMIMLFIYLNLYVFLNKYIAYHYKTLRIKNTTTLTILNSAKRIGYFILGLQIVSVGLFLSASIVEATLLASTDDDGENRNDVELIRARLTQAAFFLLFVGATYQMITAPYLINALRKDVRFVLNNDRSERLVIYAGNTLLGLKYVFFCCVFFNSFHIVFFLLPVISLDLMRLWKYMFPAIIVSAATSTVIVLYANQLAKRKRNVGLSALGNDIQTPTPARLTNLNAK